MAPRVRMRGREFPLERVLFVVVLSCSLLLLSVVMLRSEQHAVPPKRTFRDGFIVAQDQAQRRAEADNATSKARATDKAAETVVKDAVVLESGGGGGGVVGKPLRVENDADTTRIQTEDGDEITIKRAANSNKITTISAHEDGKITIEKRDKVKTDVAATEGDSHVANALEKRKDKEKSEKLPLPAADADMDAHVLTSYEKIALGREPEAPVAAPNGPKDMEARRREEATGIAADEGMLSESRRQHQAYKEERG